MFAAYSGTLSSLDLKQATGQDICSSQLDSSSAHPSSPTLCTGLEITGTLENTVHAFGHVSISCENKL